MADLHSALASGGARPETWCPFSLPRCKGRRSVPRGHPMVGRTGPHSPVGPANPGRHADLRRPHRIRDCGDHRFPPGPTRRELRSNRRRHLSPVNAGTPGRTVIARPLTPNNTDAVAPVGERCLWMCLTLTNATAIIDHHPNLRPDVRVHPYLPLRVPAGPGWCSAPALIGPAHRDRVRHLRNRKQDQQHDRITVVDQYAHAYTYRADELVPTAVPDALTVRLTCRESTR